MQFEFQTLVFWGLFSRESHGFWSSVQRHSSVSDDLTAARAPVDTAMTNFAMCRQYARMGGVRSLFWGLADGYELPRRSRCGITLVR